MTTRGWAAFGAVCFLWGLPYLLIKVAVDDGVPPVFLSWARVVLGAGTLAIWAWRAGTFRGLRGRVRWIALFAIAELVIPFPLIAAAERAVDSSVAAILVATAPLFVAVLALRFDRSERVDGRRFVGLVVGLVGVAALVGLEFSGRPAELLGAAAILAAALGYAVGPMIIRARLRDLDPTATMAAALTIAGLVLLPFALVELPIAVPSTQAIASIVALGVLCNGVVLAIYGALVLIAGAGRALLVTYINPLVATALGVVFLGERPGSGAVVGLTLILAGSWLASRNDGRL
jgi:drug/metabolite transporter (DMT)-like permease